MADNTDTTTQNVRQTEVGFEMVIESKRGTGVRDQDKAVMTYKSEGKPQDSDIHEMLTRIEYILDTRRQHQPDAGGESE